VIIAPNHVNYLDAPLLIGFTPRPIHFIAGSNAFQVPVWTSLMRLYGTIPVERGKADTSAIKLSLSVLNRGGVLGLFPEGTFTEDGHAVRAKMGAAHLALKTGAVIVPVTLTGAFHSWPRLGPKKRRLPRPWRLVVKFHPPIQITPEEIAQHQKDKEFERQLTERIMEDISRTLEPAIRAEQKVDTLVAAPAPHIRLYELFPLFLTLAAAFLLGLYSEWFTHPETAEWALRFFGGFLGLGCLYFLYLWWDVKRPRQTAFMRAVRSYSPVIFVLFYYPLLVRSIPVVAEVARGMPTECPGWLTRLIPPWNWAITGWLMVAHFTFIIYLLLNMRYYHFNKYILFQRFMRGLLLCFYATLLTILFVPVFGSSFPLAVPSSELGVVGRMVSAFSLSRLVVISFPVITVTLTLYCLLFDWFSHRRMFYLMFFPALSAVSSVVWMRGYPIGGIAFSLLIVAGVLLYMRLFPFTAHDGRAV